MSYNKDKGARNQYNFKTLKGVNAPKILVAVEMLHLDKKSDGMGIKSRKPGQLPADAYGDWDGYSNIDASRDADGERLTFTAEVPMFSEVCAFPSRTGVISDWKNKKTTGDTHSTEQAIFIVYVFKGGKASCQENLSDDDKDLSKFEPMWLKRKIREGCNEILVSLDDGGNIERCYVDKQKINL